MDKITIDGIEVDKRDFDIVNGLIRDSGESAFFLRELEYKKKKSYDTKQKRLKATALLPVSAEADPGADTITYQRVTQIGIAKIISDYADDAPRADVYGEEISTKVYTVGNYYGYSRQEIRRSKLAGRSLDQKRANSAKRASDEKIESIAWTGDAAHNISGFINYPGITEYVVPNGAAASKTFASKTPDEIIADIKGMINAVSGPTNGLEEPDTLLLPWDQYFDLATRRVTDGGEKTILTYIKENFPMLKNIEWISQLKIAGTGSTARMMVYPKNPDNVTLEIPMPYSVLPPQVKGYGFEILTETRVAGVIIYYPLAVAFGDGI